MTVLDAYAIVAYLENGPAAPDVESLLRRGDCTTTAIGIAEVTDRLVRVSGVDEQTAQGYLTGMRMSEAVPVDAALGAAAGRLRAYHYHRVRRAVSMADCVAAVAASRRQEPLATSDPHLLDLCHEERIPTTPLPASDGSVWKPS